jgi:hypothetical protein
VPGQRAGSGKAAAGFRIPRPSAGWFGEGRGGLVGRGPSGRSAGWLEGLGWKDWTDGTEMANGAEDSGCVGVRMERSRRARRALGRCPLRASVPTEPNGRPRQTPIGGTSARSGSVQQQCIRAEGGSRANLKQVLPPPPDRIHCFTFGQEMKTCTHRIAEAVEASGLTPLHPHGYARCALMTDYDSVADLNEELRRIIPDWQDDDWAIGQDGAGNYFVMSQSRSYPGVRFWDHETNEILDEFDSIDVFISDALRIERDNQNQAEQVSGGNGR